MHYGFLTILFKYRKAVCATFLAVVLSGVGYILFAVPKYESVAELVVRFGDRSIPDVNHAQVTEMTPADRREIVLSHAAILGSHDLALATIKSFGLKTVYPNILADPPSRWTPMDEAVKTFLKNLSVDVGTQDNIITVTMLHPNKLLVPKLVQKLIDLYVEHQTAVYQNPQLNFLAVEVKQSGERLATAQAALEQFKSQWHVTDYDQEVQDLLKQRGDVDTNLRAAQANLVLAQHRKQDMERLIRTVPANQEEPASGEKYRALDDAKTRLGELRVKQSQMLATYTPDSPAMTALNASMAAAQKEVDARQQELEARSSSTPNSVYQTLQTDYLRNSADAESNAGPVRVLTEQLASVDQRLQDLQQNRGTFDDLTRKRQISEDTYRSLSTQYEDARVKDSLNQQRISPATVISQPTLPYRTARPRKLIVLAACLFCGVILAVGTALLLEALNERFTTAEQVVLFLDLPVLACFERGHRHVARPLLGLEGAR